VTKAGKIRLVIADDHPIFRQGLVRIVESASDFELVGEAGDGDAALALIHSLRPAMAVMDVSMPGLTGLEILKRMKEEELAIDVVVLTMYREEEYFSEAMDLGAKGYLLKESAVGDLLQCLRVVADGGYYVSPLVSSYLIHRREKREDLRQRIPSLDTLTAAERQILSLIALNLTSKEIATRLHISHRTVQNHRANICTKLGLEGHNKLLQFAFEHRDLL
jgi:DNA-binding NarL/FixJ family response regulator